MPKLKTGPSGPFLKGSAVGDVPIWDGDEWFAGPLPALNPTDYTIVESVSDFPAPVAGVITLTPGVWWVNGVIDMGALDIVIASGAYLRGFVQAKDGLTWTAAGVSTSRLTFQSAGFELHQCKELFLSPFANEPVFGVVGTPLGMEIRNISISGGGIGQLAGSAFLLVDVLNATSLTGVGLTPVGGGAQVILRTSNIESAAGNTNALLNFGSIVWDRISVRDLRIANANAGQVCVAGLAANGNLTASTGRGDFQAIRFEGPGPALSGISTSDLQWTFSNSQGIINSLTIANAELSNNASPTIINSVGVFELVAGVFTSTIARRFTVSSGGVFTYTSPDIRPVRLIATLTAMMASGASKNVSFRFHLNGNPIGVSFTVELIGSASRVVAVMGIIPSLSTSDTIDLRLANQSDTISVIVVDLEFQVFQADSGF